MIIVREFEYMCKSNARLWTLQYSKGTTIYSERDANRHWYEVIQGIIRTCRFHSNGHRQLTGFYYAGDVFGVDPGAEHAESAEAVTDALIRRHDWGVAADSAAAESSERTTALQQALDNARRCIFLFGHKTAIARVAAFLIAIEERLDAVDDVDVPMSRGDIADHLGLALHTVSRTISDLARQGLIALAGPKSIRIVNRAALRMLAGAETVETASRPEPGGQTISGR